MHDAQSTWNDAGFTTEVITSWFWQHVYHLAESPRGVHRLLLRNDDHRSIASLRAVRRVHQLQHLQLPLPQRQRPGSRTSRFWWIATPSHITTSVARLYLGPMTSPPNLPLTGPLSSTPGTRNIRILLRTLRLSIGICRQILSSLQNIRHLPPSISVVVSMREFKRHISLIDGKS